MQNSFYGYIRVSSKQQNEDRQRIALINCGVPQEKWINKVGLILNVLNIRTC